MDINVTIIGQIITFVILVLFTMKFVWPPLNHMMEERAKKIADGLAAAEKGQQELLSAETRVAEELQHVQLRATEIISNAEKRANQMIESAKLNAVSEADKVMLDAKTQIEQEFVRAKEELRSRVAQLVISGAQQILRAEINQEKHALILNNLKAEL